MEYMVELSWVGPWESERTFPLPIVFKFTLLKFGCLFLPCKLNTQFLLHVPVKASNMEHAMKL